MPPLSGVGVVVVVGAVLGVVVGVQKGEDHPHTPTWQHRLLPALARAPINTQADAAKINCADVVDGPRDVSELRCVSINWEDFYCNWTLPHNDPPWDTHPYQAQLHYHTDFGRSPECSECSKSPGEYGYGCQCPQECCWWRNGDAYMASEQMAQVVFLVGDNCSFTHTLDTYALVLPDAVQDRQAQSLPNTLDVNVSWTLPSPMGTFSRLAKGGVVYRIDHRLVSTSTWTTAVMERCTERQCVGESVVRVAVVLGLNWWYQQYQVRVRLRSGAANTTLEEDGWWSTWQPFTATTPATVPGGAPSVGADSLQVMVEEPEGREVVLAWRPLPPLLHNGPQFTYHATATSLHTSEVVAAAEVKDTYATFSRLSNTQSYRLEVVAENSEGRSNQTSWVRLGTAASLPPAPLLPVVIFHPQLDLYELRWSEEGEGSMSVASFTVYLCQLLPGVSFTHDEPCTGELFWLAVGNISAVNVSLAQFNLTQTTRSSPGSLRFAVSAQTELETSSGMSWDQCDSPRPYTTTSRPPEDVMVQDVESQWARVSWTVGCEAHAGVVEGVGVYYCQGQHNTTQQCEGNEVWAPWTSTSVDLTNLDEDTSYTVWVHLMYRAGTSQWSSPASLTTQHSVLEVWLISIITVAVVLLAVTLGLVLRYSRRRLADTVHDVTRPINLPAGLIPADSGKPAAGTGESCTPPQDCSVANKDPTLDLAFSDDFLPRKEESKLERLRQTGGRVPGGRGLTSGHESDDNLYNQNTEEAASTSSAALPHHSPPTTQPSTTPSPITLPTPTTPHLNYIIPFFPSETNDTKEGKSEEQADGSTSVPSQSPGPLSPPQTTGYLPVLPSGLSYLQHQHPIIPEFENIINTHMAGNSESERLWGSAMLRREEPSPGYVSVPPPDSIFVTSVSTNKGAMEIPVGKYVSEDVAVSGQPPTDSNSSCHPGYVSLSSTEFNAPESLQEIREKHACSTQNIAVSQVRPSVGYIAALPLNVETTSTTSTTTCNIVCSNNNNKNSEKEESQQVAMSGSISRMASQELGSTKLNSSGYVPLAALQGPSSSLMPTAEGGKRGYISNPFLSLSQEPKQGQLTSDNSNKYISHDVAFSTRYNRSQSYDPHNMTGWIPTQYSNERNVPFDKMCRAVDLNKGYVPLDIPFSTQESRNKDYVALDEPFQTQDSRSKNYVPLDEPFQTQDSRSKNYVPLDGPFQTQDSRSKNYVPLDGPFQTHQAQDSRSKGYVPLDGPFQTHQTQDSRSKGYVPLDIFQTQNLKTEDCILIPCNQVLEAQDLMSAGYVPHDTDLQVLNCSSRDNTFQPGTAVTTGCHLSEPNQEMPLKHKSTDSTGQAVSDQDNAQYVSAEAMVLPMAESDLNAPVNSSHILENTGIISMDQLMPSATPGYVCLDPVVLSTGDGSTRQQDSGSSSDDIEKSRSKDYKGLPTGYSRIGDSANQE